jgi:hypothetical protein
MVIFMPVTSKESVEAILKEVLELQKDLAAFLKSKSGDPAVIALALQTACHIVLDDHDEGSYVTDTFDEMVNRLSTVVALGHEAILRSLRDGTYENVFSVSVEIGAAEGDSADLCPQCADELDVEVVYEDDADPYSLN